MEIVLTEVGLALLVGFVALAVFAIVNCIDSNSGKKSDGKAESKDNKGQDTSEDNESVKPDEVASVPHAHKFRRAESIKNEHVVFADEFSPEDEKFSPKIEDGLALEGILQNRTECPLVADDPESEVEASNTFEDIHPLDDLGLEIRRKSLQLTPAGSQANSQRGSRTDLNKVGLQSSRDISEDDEATEGGHTRTLKFSDEAKEEESVKKLSKTLRKVALTDVEINMLIEILVKREEEEQESGWVDTRGQKIPSMVATLKDELREKTERLSQAEELAEGLQVKMDKLRQDWSEEKAKLKETVKLLEEAKAANEIADVTAARQSQQLTEEGHLHREEISQLRQQLGELDDLRARLRAEEAENHELSQSVREQQGVIKAALRQLFPSMEVGELCPEHQEAFDKFVSRLKKE